MGEFLRLDLNGAHKTCHAISVEVLNTSGTV